MVESHLTGVLPRSERLVEVTRLASRGKASKEELESALNRDITSLVELQKKAGLDYAVDGQLNWQDLLRPFSELFSGIQLGGLTRWFDNNTFYRKPIIADKVRYTGDNLENYFRHESLPSETARKAILPGPYTFAVMSQNVAYPSLPDLVDDLAHALRDLLRELKALRYEYFQFNEPSVCFSRTAEKDASTLKHAYDVCAKIPGGRTSLHTYFGDASAVLDELLDCPVDSIGVDFYATSIESLRERRFNKQLGCGCIDGRNSLLESPDELRKLLARIREEIEPKGLCACPNCDLEFLPRVVAEKKIAVLAETKKLPG